MTTSKHTARLGLCKLFQIWFDVVSYIVYFS
ncbi:unnamed protein product [Cuscuta europaea]|uniref:Uncharacterized protein n=1 Tax=Cuscuta europaea TaxID=41803 RepID=A0A9P0ZPY6_CUSEU|nr:unnamed protein product [Cuscuta europaea]